MSDPHNDHPDDSTPPQSAVKSPFAPGSPVGEHYRPPRLRIIHLLAWTAATAALLKFSIAVEMIGQTDAYSRTPAWNVFQQATYFVYNTAHAAGFVGTGILLLAKVRRLPGRLQPGHWLLLITTVGGLLYLSCYSLADSWAADVSSHQWILMVYGLAGIVWAGMYFGAAWVCKDGRRWKICFATLGALGLMRGLSYVAMIFSLFGTLRFFSLGAWIVWPALLLTVVFDLRGGPRRDWLHWVGVAIVATGAVMPAVEWLWPFFGGPMQISF